MKLTDLEPRWLSDNVFAFRCPHCQKVWLTCKNAPLSRDDQMELVQAAGLEPTGPRYGAVLMRDISWAFSSKDFATLSVTPSIDASESGHWHGFITNGEIK